MTRSLLSAAAVPDALDAVAVPLAEARMLDASSGEIVAVETDDEAVSVLLPSEPSEPDEPDELEEDEPVEPVVVGAAAFGSCASAPAAAAAAAAAALT